MSTRRIFLTILTACSLAVVATQASEDPLSLLPKYVLVSTALAADDLNAAHSAAQRLAEAAVVAGDRPISDAAKTVAQAKTLPAAREAFKTLSTPVIALAKQTKGYFILNCPMAQADWVQSTREVANPYLGQAMLRCGEVKEETKGGA